ncbi:hypothetical protein K474DRAFT_1459379 [Panus rudis PR-1116 ss-1]|nr:hypothetical protein K474DRAFT_1459379 [Panus rudis PR-1116 ss-1]
MMGRLISFAVSISTGQWGIATKTIHTFGSTDYDCPGLESNSKTKAEVQQQAADAAAQLEAQRRQRRTRLILGIVLGITLPLIAIAAVVYWWWRRRKFLTDPSRGIYDGQDANVRAWNPTPPPPDPASGFVGYGGAEMREGVPHPISTTPSSKSLSSYPTNLGGGGYTVPLMSHAYSQSAPSDVYTPTGSTSGAVTMSGDYSTSQWMSAGGSGSPGGALSPEMSPARRKAIEARAERVSSYPSTSLAGSSSSPLPPGASPASNPSFHSYDPEVRPDIIIQHRDGGSGVVQELPPPYVDRGTGSPHPPEGP